MLLRSGEPLTSVTGNWLTRSHAPPLVRSLRVIAGVRNGHPRKHSLPPLPELLLELLGPIGFARNQIVFLADIVRNVVELAIPGAVEVLDELPIACAYAARRTVMMVVGVVPMNGIAIELCRWIVKERFEAVSIDRLVIGELTVGEIHKRGEEVIADGGFCTSGPSFR